MTIVSVIFGALGMIKNGTDKHLSKIAEYPRRYEIQKLHLVELLISAYNWKNIPQMRQQKRIYIEYKKISTFPQPRSWLKSR